MIYRREAECLSGLYVAGGCVGDNQSCLTWKRAGLGGICIGIWGAKRYRQIRKGGWGN